MKHRLLTTTLLATLLVGALSACAPLMIGGAAVGTVLMASDRRTSGAQIDDEAIELRAASRMREAFSDQAHINVTSYNRQVLLTGEVPSEAARVQAEQIISRVDNVLGVVNELAVMASTTLPQRSGDVLITGKVRASFVDAADLQANAFKVVTERGVVYLMGRVTAREAERVTLIARQIGGVQKVIRMFELVSADDLWQSGMAPRTTTVPATVAPWPAPAPAAAAVPAAAPPASPTPGVETTPVR